MRIHLPLRFQISDAIKIRGLLLARLLIGGLFFYSGLSKLIQPIEYFEVAIDQYSLFPAGIIHGVALVVPWVELISGTYLLLGYMPARAAGVLAFLTGLFQIVLAQALLRHLP